MVMDDPTLPRIKVRDLLMQAFLTGWTRSDKAVSQDEAMQMGPGCRARRICLKRAATAPA